MDEVSGRLETTQVAGIYFSEETSFVASDWTNDVSHM